MDSLDILHVINEYVGSSMTNKCLRDIKRYHLMRAVRNPRHKYLYYNVFQQSAGQFFTAVKITNLCSCRYSIFCNNPYCPVYGRFVQFVAKQKSQNIDDVLIYKRLL